MTERKKINFISSVEIMNTSMKKQWFIVDGMIYPGIHILSGDPKIGKSWMMNLCLAIAKGEKFFGRTTQQGQVVYMAPEDTFISLQSRVYELTRFYFREKSLNGTASEICSMLKKFPEQEFNCNWLYRDLLQHDDEIRTLGIDYGKAKSNDTRSIFICYSSNRDSSGSKILCEENGVPAVPEITANADDYLCEVGCTELSTKKILSLLSLTTKLKGTHS